MLQLEELFLTALPDTEHREYPRGLSLSGLGGVFRMGLLPDCLPGLQRHQRLVQLIESLSQLFFYGGVLRLQRRGEHLELIIVEPQLYFELPPHTPPSVCSPEGADRLGLEDLAGVEMLSMYSRVWAGTYFS